MALLDDLLSRGYFPKELPSGFSTTAFGTWAGPTVPALVLGKRSPRMCFYNLARTRGLRRRLGIPNPVPHFSLCKAIADNYPQIDTVIRTSTLSVSKPTLDPKKLRAVVPENREGRLIDLRAGRRTAAKYVLRADVADFYPSIYTHAIPWVAHTRATAKANKQDKTLYGNLMDQWVRLSQDGQTMGIPVGPDTSFLIAEMVMAGVEHEYRKQFPSGYRPRGFRFYDDIELAFDSRAEAEAAIPKLERALAQFELRLNPTKTSIDALPQGLGESWTADIRSFEFRQKSQHQRLDLIRYFDLLFELIGKGCSETVVAYAMSRLDSGDLSHVHTENRPLLQNMIAQCVATHPSSIRFGVRQLLRLRERGQVLDPDLMRDTLNLVIKAHAPLGHSSEVAWAIWSAMAFGTPIDLDAARLISAMEDSVVAILAVDAERVGRINGLDRSSWRADLNADGLYDDQWLMAYEFDVQNWLPTGVSKYVGSDSNFRLLEAAGVRFYTPFSSTNSAAIVGPDLADYE
jgi:hypothetical protein